MSVIPLKEITENYNICGPPEGGPFVSKTKKTQKGNVHEINISIRLSETKRTA